MTALSPVLLWKLILRVNEVCCSICTERRDRYIALEFCVPAMRYQSEDNLTSTNTVPSEHTVIFIMILSV